MSINKLIVPFAVISATALLIIKSSSLLQFAKTISITPRLDGGMKRLSFHQGKLRIPLAIEFANRSDQELTVAVPSFFLYFNDKNVGEIRPNTNKVLIKKHSTSTLNNILVEIPWTQLLSIFGQVITAILKPPYDYTTIVRAIRMDITVIINDSLVVNVSQKLDQKKEVNLSTGQTSQSNNLGLVPYSQRKIGSVRDYQMYISPKSTLEYADRVVIPNGTTTDTVELMHAIALKHKEDTRLLAPKLKRGNQKETLQSVFNFVYKYIAYVPDSTLQEQVRRPLRTLWDQKGDCDCYATLIGSILANLGIPYKFRIAAYNGNPNYQHVYVIVPHGANDYYVVDPVLDKCFDEKPPSKYKDF